MDKSKNDETEQLRKRVAELEAQLKKKEEAKGRAFQRKLLKKTGLKKLSKEELETLEEDYTNLLEGRKPLIEGKLPITLQNHQKRFIEAFLYSNLRSAILFHGVGTGKTFSAVATTKAYLQIYPKNKVMVITPPALLFNFIDSMIAYGLNPQDKRFSYYSYTTFANQKIDTKDSLLIVDEAHNLRTVIDIDEQTDEDTGRVKEFVRTGKRPFLTIKKAEKAHKVILLTATPFINKPYDIENLLAIGEGRLPYNEDVFGNMISDDKGRYDYFKYRISKFFNPTGDENFPEKREKFVPIEIERDTKEGDKIVARAGKMNPAYVYSRLSSLETNNAKFKYIVNEINKPENNGKKFVVYTSFMTGVSKIEKYLNKGGIDKIGVISGKKSTIEKANAIDAYNNDEIRVMIITRAGAEGVSLNETRGIFVIDGVWNEALYTQIIARAIRYKSHAKLPKNDRFVNVYKLFVCYPNEGEELEKINKGGKFNYSEWLNSFLTVKKLEKTQKTINKGFSLEKLSTLKKGSVERREYLKNNMAFPKNKAGFVAQDIISNFEGMPSTDFYMFVLQKSKLQVIDKLIEELTKIPVIEKTISDMPEVRKLYDEIHNNPMGKTDEEFIKDLQKILQGEEIKAGKLLERSIDNKESKLSKFIEKKKEVSALLKAKMKVRVKQEFFTPTEFVDELITLSGFEFSTPNKIYNILEPSAGWGNIVKGLIKVIQRKKLNCDIDLVEIQPDNRKVLQELSDIIPHMIHLQKEPDFIKFLSSKKYDYVFMNPPFHLQASRNKEYTKDVYSYHFVMRAYAMLKEDGVLVAITGREWEKDENAKKFYKSIKAKTINKTVKWGGQDLKKGAEVSKLDITFIKIVKNVDNPKLDNELIELTDKLVKQPEKQDREMVEMTQELEEEKPKKEKKEEKPKKEQKEQTTTDKPKRRGRPKKPPKTEEQKKQIKDFSSIMKKVKNFKLVTEDKLKKFRSKKDARVEVKSSERKFDNFLIDADEELNEMFDKSTPIKELNDIKKMFDYYVFQVREKIADLYNFVDNLKNTPEEREPFTSKFKKKLSDF